MANGDFTFVVPTYRLRDVGETIEKYDENFWNNGHHVKMYIFDDSSVVNHDKYFKELEKIKTHNPVYYVGPNEKKDFITFLLKRLNNVKLEQVVHNLFRPSYGGNRNFTLMYTLGEYMISSDDDMRPFGYMAEIKPSLQENEICRGKIMLPGENGYQSEVFDVLDSFEQVLGKKIKDVPVNYAVGTLIRDSAMDLETNTSNGLKKENSLYLEGERINRNSIVKMAQSFRTGTSDIDALDYAELFLGNDRQIDPQELNSKYIILNLRPAVTEKNWRMDCGVAGYDNRHGLPPFFPTRLRFEDYIYRLWANKGGVASAHVGCVQNHMKSNYMRDPLGAEILNEEIANLLKRKIKNSVSKVGNLSIEFDYDGTLTTQDTEEILNKITGLHKIVVEKKNKTDDPVRREALHNFAVDLERKFYSFEPDFFQQNVSRFVDDEVGLIKSSLGIWQDLVEKCFFRKSVDELPATKIDSQR